MNSNLAEDNFAMVSNGNEENDNNEDINIDNKIAENTKKEHKPNIVYLFIKRVIDIIGGLIGIIFLVPITIVIFIIRVIIGENDGPIFYSHTRIGKNGKRFKIYKFRSMVKDADKILEDYLKENEEAKKEFDEYQKLQDDPRITKFR